MWEVMTYGERPYWELSNHEVGPPCPAQPCLDLSLNPSLDREEFWGLIFVW